MPFQSKAQKAWMHQNHPEMAMRWERDTPRSASLPEHKGSSESNETNRPGVPRLPRSPGPKRDFRSLSPNQFSRHPGAGSEKESMEEWGVEAHHPDGRREKMSLGTKNVLDPLAKRDVKKSARKRV